MNVQLEHPLFSPKLILHDLLKAAGFDQLFFYPETEPLSTAEPVEAKDVG
jgi:hypothetical protein